MDQEMKRKYIKNFIKDKPLGYEVDLDAVVDCIEELLLNERKEIVNKMFEIILKISKTKNKDPKDVTPLEVLEQIKKHENRRHDKQSN